jgi:hypothetical protein
MPWGKFLLSPILLAFIPRMCVARHTWQPDKAPPPLTEAVSLGKCKTRCLDLRARSRYVSHFCYLSIRGLNVSQICRCELF